MGAMVGNLERERSGGPIGWAPRRVAADSAHSSGRLKVELFRKVAWGLQRLLFLHLGQGVQGRGCCGERVGN